MRRAGLLALAALVLLLSATAAHAVFKPSGAQNAAQITPTIGNLPSPVIKTYQGTGRSTAGAITATGVNVGDVITGALCWTTSTGAVVGLNTTQFVGPVSTTNQIPQTGATDISLQTCLFFVQPRS